MEEKFQSIVDNYINGNRGDARKGIDALSSNEMYNFHGWLVDLYEQAPIHVHETGKSMQEPRSDLFKMVCFFLLA